MQRYLRLLRRRDYALFWGGATVSALGDGMSFVALVWLVLERGGDPGTVGWLAATYTAPVVVGGLVAGVVLDRFDRRLVLAADNLIRGAAIASIPIASAVGMLSTAQLFVVAGIYGLLFMASLAGIPSLIPALVDAEDLTTANAMESLTYGIAALAGPALAGVVIAVFGAPVVLAIDAGTYAVFVVCLVALGPVRSAAEAEDRPTGRSASVESRSGGLRPAIRFVLGAPAILAITVIYMVINVGEGIFLVLAPVYARDVLGGGATTYGTLVSSFTAGSLVGVLLVGGIGWRWPLGRSIAAATLAAGLVLGLLLATPPSSRPPGSSRWPAYARRRSPCGRRRSGCASSRRACAAASSRSSGRSCSPRRRSARWSVVRSSPVVTLSRRSPRWPPSSRFPARSA